MTRIGELPRRDWRARVAPFIEPLSALLKTAEGSQTLRPAQAALLLEAPENLGGFLNGRVGVGKTLAIIMSIITLRAKIGPVRALVLCPGGIKSATNRHFQKLREHWALPHPSEYELMSYNIVSLMPGKGDSIGNLFGKQGPNVIICDEADALKNVGPGGSALARQIEEWMSENPNTVFIAVTGTCDVDGILDYGHLIDWALRERSPLPRDYQTLCDWSDVIDHGDMAKAPWVCQDLGISRDSSLEAIRDAYRERVCSAPGVIIEDTPFTDVDLKITEHILIDPALDEHYARLRDLWQRPDGAEIEGGSADEDQDPDRVEGTTIWPVARRMGRGLCYIWDPRPPEDWLAARRAYFGWARAMVEKGFFYTEAGARAHAIEIGHLKWLAWQDIQPEYTPVSRTLWLSDGALAWCENWGKQAPGIIWIDDIAFGVALAHRTGWTYYQAKGKAADGSHIEKASGTAPVLASRKSCGTGLNLQQFNRMLFPTPVNKSRDFEQNTGRCHREGQTKDVHVDILLTCAEDFRSMAKMRASARRTQRSLYTQKAALYDWPSALKPDEGRAFIS